MHRQRTIVQKQGGGGGELARALHCEIMDEIVTRDGLEYDPTIDYIDYFNDNDSYVCDTDDESDDESDIGSDVDDNGDEDVDDVAEINVGVVVFIINSI